MTNLAPKIEKELLASIMDAKTEAAQRLPLVNHRYDVLYITRLSKIALVASVAWLLSLTVINNIGDYHTYFQVVKNIMSMKSVYLHHQDSWRAITTPALQHLCYWIIIFWQAAAAILCWAGAYHCWQAIRAQAHVFHQAKSLAISGLTLIMLMWIVAYLGMGGQWFLMWQSELWNMQDTAFRMFTLVGIILIFLCLPEKEDYHNYL